MSQITIGLIKDLRERTAAGMSDCKKALVECDADIDKAIEYLRKKGLSKAAKKSGRVATEGLVSSYIHSNGRVGVLVEVNCETDFVALNEDFQTFVKEVSLQIAAMNPSCVLQDELDADEIEKERGIYREKALAEGKPEKIVDKIVDGQIGKWMKDVCLMEQRWVKDDKKSIFDLQQALVAKLGENIKVRRFVRFELGEGLQKKEEDFAAEVAKTAGLA